ncbi:probable pectinesterase 8 isoform X2 [Triticum urartu]|uniref:Pectinesterase n=1 Tax=Triticum urartu TaxID=4572 RepID=A0A8R7VKT1_TRIUA|nr:probable pectinesterase 8 isoform X2 [Triticum urartu]
MSTKAISLYFCVPAAFLLFFAHLNNPTTSFLRALLDLATPSFPFNLLTVHYFSNYHRHRGAYNPLCDDFPPDFPLPDTAATSIFCVDPNGCCDFTTVQSAVDAVPRSSQKRNVLWINKGIYLEKVTVPATKANITFQGQGFDLTAIMWNDTANSSHGTFYSASVSVFATGFVAKNISFMNVAPIPRPGDVGAQAVALRIGGDQAAFWGCGFFGAQDTLHDDRGRHYFKECFIQGSIDFIFGDARSLYENCRLISIADPVPAGVRSITGSVTAHARESNKENSGYSFVNCSIGGTGWIWLGRAWRPYSRVVFAYTTMSNIIASDGWNDWNDPSRDQSVFYGEYKCTGDGAHLAGRVPYALELSDVQALPYLNTSFIDGDLWLKPYCDSLISA